MTLSVFRRIAGRLCPAMTAIGVAEGNFSAMRGLIAFAAARSALALVVYTNGNFALCFPMPDSNSSMARWRSDDAKALNGLIALV